MTSAEGKHEENIHIMHRLWRLQEKELLQQTPSNMTEYCHYSNTFYGRLMLDVVHASLFHMKQRRFTWLAFCPDGQA